MLDSLTIINHQPALIISPPECIIMKVNEKIKHLRQLQGWSQEDVANKLEMSPNGYGNIERGDTDVTLSKLEKLAELFGMELAELVELDKKHVFNLNTQNNNQHCNINIELSIIDLSISENSQLKSALEKQQALNEQQAQEIQYLRSLLESVLKKEMKQD
jgi:transcriptional regulator with XRE-family HTH domain